MSLQRLFINSDGNSAVHKLHDRTKLSLTGTFALLAVLLDSTATLYGAFWLLLLLHGVCRHPRGRWKLLMALLLLSVWSSMLSQAIFYQQEPRTPLVCLVSRDAPLLGRWTDGVYLYQEGLRYGALQSLRASILLLAGFLFSWTSDSRALLRTLRALRLPYEIAFMIVTAAQFLPVVADELQSVLLAQKLRGCDPLSVRRPGTALSGLRRTLLPLLSRALRRAEVLAVSVTCRGFGASAAPPAAGQSFRQRVACRSMGLLLLGLLACKALDLLQRAGLYYAPQLRPLYDAARLWL